MYLILLQKNKCLCGSVLLLQVQLVGLDEESSEFICRNTFDHPYPTTKLMWIPDTKGVYPDLLATSGDYLRVWRVSRCLISSWTNGLSPCQLLLAWRHREQTGVGGSECHCSLGETNGSVSAVTLFGSTDFLVNLAKIPWSPAAGCSQPWKPEAQLTWCNDDHLLWGWAFLRPLILFTAKIFLSKLNKIPGHWV